MKCGFNFFLPNLTKAYEYNLYIAHYIHKNRQLKERTTITYNKLVILHYCRSTSFLFEIILFELPSRQPNEPFGSL